MHVSWNVNRIGHNTEDFDLQLNEDEFTEMKF